MMTSSSGRVLPPELGALRFTEIVVPMVNESLHDRGFAAAVVLAARLNLPVRLVHVHQSTRIDERATEATAALDLTSERLHAQYPALTLKHEVVLAADVAHGIEEVLTPASMVVLATEHAGVEDGSFSLAEALSRRWDGVLVMLGPKAHVPERPGPVVVPLDGSPAGERALVGAAGLVGVWRGPMWLVHVVDSATGAKIVELRDAGYAISESAMVRDLSHELGEAGLPAAWEIVHDEDPVDAIVRFAREHQASLIAATTHGAGRTSAPFGRVCMRIVHESTVPVAVVGIGVTRSSS